MAQNSQSPTEILLTDSMRRAVRYMQNVPERRVAPTSEQIARLELLSGPLPENSSDPASVFGLLDEVGSPATVACTGGRYFGFVTGGALPATVAANWLATAWDQNAGFAVQSPVAVQVEAVAVEWLRELLGLPSSCGAGVVTGATMANFAALAAARHALLGKAGWDVEENGLFGAPAISVVVGHEVHASVKKALSLVGFGRSRVVEVPTDDQGRMKGDELPPLNDRTLVCIQAGNVNTGAFDPAMQICERARAAGAWVHVDGAFGLWAAAAPSRKHLVSGFTDADSWAVDCHKWLNVPYDSGVAFVREPKNLKDAMTVSASYLQAQGAREPCHYAPEFSRRARGIEIWAALKSLGRRGVAEMIERNCRQASFFADCLRREGYSVLNDVVLNQVLVSFGDAETTRRVVSEIQSDGTCWCGSTEWHGQAAMRISVSCWATTQSDIERSVEAILRIAQNCGTRRNPTTASVSR
jgi:glutamate/tyrosine decarboxylase-like PLP-dependent enzyme